MSLQFFFIFLILFIYLNCHRQNYYKNHPSHKKAMKIDQLENVNIQIKLKRL
jgi:hypothetical protein